MRYILGFLLSFSLCFSLELSDKEFSETIKIGTSKTKEYSLKNNSELKKEYFFSSDDSNVKIRPKGFRLKPFEERKFKITATPNKIGKKQYYLEIKEVIREKPKENSVNINKVYRIQQHYIGE